MHVGGSRSVAWLSPVASPSQAWESSEGILLEENEARRRAEEFGRALTDRWDEWAFKVGLWATPAVTGIYGFTWYPTAKDDQGRQIRIEGNWPILVDQNTGVCRLVQGPKEMARFRGTSEVRTARWRSAPTSQPSRPNNG